MAANVATRATVPAASALPPTASVRVRARAVTWSWRAFLTVVYLVLFGPLVILMLFSINDSNVLAFPLEGVTFHWYTDAFHDQLLHSALVNSIVVACIVAPICLVLGTLTAFGLTRFRFRGRGAVGGLVGAPLILPWLIIGIAALMAYGRLHVALNLRPGIPTQTICTFPLVTAMIAAQLFRFEREQEEAGIDLGCSRLQVLRHIILPHIASALAASAIFAFTWSFNNFEISFFTIGFQQTFPIWVYSSVRNPDHTAVVNAISVVISVVQVALIYLAVRLLRRGSEDETGVIVAVAP